MRPCWYYQAGKMMLVHDKPCEVVIELRAETDRPEERGDCWCISDTRLSDEQVEQWYGRRIYFGEDFGPRDYVLQRSPDPPPECIDFMVVDESFFSSSGEECRYAAVAKTNAGGECWSSGGVYYRSPEYHAVPEGPAYEIAAILAAAEGSYDTNFKRFALVHNSPEDVTIWNPRSTGREHPRDFLRLPKVRLIELLRGWLRPDELL